MAVDKPRKKSRLVVAVAAAALVPLNSGPAQADLIDIIPGLFATQIVLAPPAEGFPSHETHFLDEGLALIATGGRISDSLVTHLSTFPMVSSASGFAYTFDPAVGTVTRRTDSFGPFFTERAFTTGEGKWSVGLTHQRSRFDSLDGIDLRNGELEFQLVHVELGPPNTLDPFVQGDIINVNTLIDLKSRTTVVSLNRGFTDRFDLGVAIPFVEVDLAAQAVLTIDRLSTEDFPGIHRFPDGSDQLTVSGFGSASGLGDILVRGKYHFLELERQDTDVAVGFDIRLPTGDEHNLRGAGVTQGKLLLIGSRRMGQVSGNVNLGYATALDSRRGPAPELPDEVTYNLGVDWAPHPRATLVLELIGRNLRNAARARRGLETFQFRPGPGAEPNSAQRRVLRLEEGTLNLLLGSFGVKYSAAPNLALTGAALVSLASDGLVDEGVTLVVGVDLSF